MIIECFNTKQVIVKTALLQLRDKVRKDYYIIAADIGVCTWVTTKCDVYNCVTDPYLIVFKDLKHFITIKAISEQSLDKTINNNFQKSLRNYFRIILS